MTATTLSALGASFLPTLSSAAAGKEARAAPVTQPRREEKQREQPSRGGSRSARPWGGTAAPVPSPGRDGGCERGHSASRRHALCVKLQKSCRDRSRSPQTVARKAPEAGGGVGHQKMRSALSTPSPQIPHAGGSSQLPSEVLGSPPLPREQPTFRLPRTLAAKNLSQPARDSYVSKTRNQPLSLGSALLSGSSDPQPRTRRQSCPPACSGTAAPGGTAPQRRAEGGTARHAAPRHAGTGFGVLGDRGTA